ncbi:hypothetical protein GLYMA_09G002550v4 [Glycine max]|nr:hypothetical protein GLYMA_09G002550v4 [Glycine max]KAH1040813.1 hypothetical protein GYH30_023594 [Glycine max]
MWIWFTWLFCFLCMLPFRWFISTGEVACEFKGSFGFQLLIW